MQALKTKILTKCTKCTAKQFATCKLGTTSNKKPLGKKIPIRFKNTISALKKCIDQISQKVPEKFDERRVL